MVPLDTLRIDFRQEAYFDDKRGRFIPAFRLLLDFQDPAGTKNYYRFRYLSWKSLDVCLTCRFSEINRFTRKCESTEAASFVPYYDYPCRGGNCWERRLSPAVNVYSDQFSDGNPVQNYEAGMVDFEDRGGILMVVDQQQISAEAFAYTSLIERNTVSSGGLNAALPATLDGNVNAVSGGAEAVLGYFAATSSSEKRLYFNQATISGTPLPYPVLNYHIPPPPQDIYRHPCEGPNRFRTRPVGWPQ